MLENLNLGKDLEVYTSIGPNFKFLEQIKFIAVQAKLIIGKINN